MRFFVWLFAAMTAAWNACAGDLDLRWMAGVRAGTSYNERSETFDQYEVAIQYALPWAWQWESGLAVRTAWDFSGGWLRGEHTDAGVFTTGPVAEVHWKDLPIYLDIGSSFTLLTRHHFARKSYGSDFQFTTHAGLNWQVTERVVVGYRYQHMSNAGLATPNPGLNLHVFVFGVRF